MFFNLAISVSVFFLLLSHTWLLIKVYYLNQDLKYVSGKLEAYLQLFRLSKDKEAGND